MTEHKGTSFVHSCVKVPVDPYSRQPTPSYERPKVLADKPLSMEKCNARRTTGELRSNDKSSVCRIETISSTENTESTREDDYSTFLEFIESIPDYGEIHHLSNEQFKQKLDYLKRKQRLLLKNLRNCLEQDDENAARSSTASPGAISGLPPPSKSSCSARTQRAKSPSGFEKSCLDLELRGKRCNFEESRTNSPLLYPSGSFSCLAEDQDFLTYRSKYRQKAAKTRRNEEILSASKDWRSGSESKSGDSIQSDDLDIRVETKSLPPRSPKRWQPTLPKPFSFTLREDAEKYMTMVEQQAKEAYASSKPGKKNPAKKRRIRPVPLTSKIPLYDKLMAEREERSRMVREEAALSLMSQVRPFKLECDRRALRALTRSSPELNGKRIHPDESRFKAKPVPRNLFSGEVYDRMLEEEYFRNLQKRIRAVELLKSSSLPPSMARRERCKSAVSSRSQTTVKSTSEDRARSSNAGRDSAALSRAASLPSERSRSSTTTGLMPPHGNNLASILRAQASREKLEREMQERLEEKRRDQMLRLRKALIGRKPAWRALRSAARHEHERDLDFRTSLRRDEAREQAERHRLQMEMMLDRVTQIPTLFERYSQDEMLLQSFQSCLKLHPKLLDSTKSETRQTTMTKKKKKKKSIKRQSSSSTDSYASLGSSSRPNSGSLTSSSGTPLSRSSDSDKNSRKSLDSRSTAKCVISNANDKKKTDRGPLKVSINDKAELIEDKRNGNDDDNDDEEAFSIDSANSRVREEREKRILNDEHEIAESVTEKE